MWLDLDDFGIDGRDRKISGNISRGTSGKALFGPKGGSARDYAHAKPKQPGQLAKELQTTSSPLPHF